MKSVIAKYPKAGCQMIYLVLRKTDLKINHKRVERVYSKHKLQLKQRKSSLLKSWSIENGFAYVSMWIIASGRRSPSYVKIRQLKDYIYPADWFFYG